LPEDNALLLDPADASDPDAVRPRHAASLVVYRVSRAGVETLMGMRGAAHRFMPNRLVFPGGSVDLADLAGDCASPLAEHTAYALRKQADARLAHGIGVAAARELLEETGLTLGIPPHLSVFGYLGRAVTPMPSPIRFNARFLAAEASHVSGSLGGDGELENLRYYPIEDALALDLAMPTRLVLQQLLVWLEMSESERVERVHTPVMGRGGWRME
jgi:8-oxo-dGTP pyrophosphatase MutT (NUDIX family)